MVKDFISTNDMQRFVDKELMSIDNDADSWDDYAGMLMELAKEIKCSIEHW